MKCSSLSLTPTSATVAVGASVQLNSHPVDDRGQVCADCAVTYVSSNTAVATVDAHGKVTAVARGTATITAHADSASATASISVS